MSYRARALFRHTRTPAALTVFMAALLLPLSFTGGVVTTLTDLAAA